ncbi:uncharacterized domain 1-containing protein [Formivibrio citricus]|uniref:Uncharacterized domain 1-containing protein n=1 Tax=Formivibrio citricus TaxID=83765 RepID=A0A1I5BNN0_9NEIS|nr:PaaI family thioesterase [Formivibrio citricus]SFN76260.1 uncharacterized domain 1-containing protein [Formivibrio citricus]
MQEMQPVAASGFFQQMVQIALGLPHCAALGLQFHALDEDRKVTLALPFKPELVGDPFSRVLHSGVVTTLADMAGAMAIFSRLNERESIATLDLRLDYLRPAQPDSPLYCQAECYRLTSQIAFTRGVVYQETPEKPVAHAVATYMRLAMPAEGAN